MWKKKAKKGDFSSPIKISVVAAIILAVGLAIALMHRFNSEYIYDIENEIFTNYVVPEQNIDKILQSYTATQVKLKAADNLQKHAIINSFILDLHKNVSKLSVLQQQTESEAYFNLVATLVSFINGTNQIDSTMDVLNKFNVFGESLLDAIDQINNAKENEVQKLLQEANAVFEKNNNYVIALVMLIIIVSVVALLMYRTFYIAALKTKDKVIYKHLQKEQDFKSIAQHSSENLLIVSSDEILFINTTLLSLLKYSESEVKQWPVVKLFCRSERERVKKQILRCLRGSEVISSLPFVLLDSKGNKIEAKVKFFLTSWQGDNAVCVSIEEVKNTPAELTKRGLNQDFFDQINGAVIWTDLRGKIKNWNRGAEAQFGYTLQEAALKNFSMLYPENEQAFLHNKLILPLYEHLNIHKDIQLQRKNGEIFYAYLSLSLTHDAEGKPSGMLAFVADISPRKTQEAELVRERESLDDLVKNKTIELRESLINLENENKRRIIAQASLIKAKNEAEKANKLKSEFLARISHELRTPLNAILGFSQLLAIEEMNDDQMEMVTEISIAGKHLINIIDEVLQLSKIESGNQKVVIEDVGVKDVIRDCVAISKMHPAAAGIEFNDQSNRRENFILRADKTKMREVLLNLLTNAVKYNKKNGVVTIDYAITDSNMLRLSVSDTGNGIDEDKLSSLFEPFDRLGAEYTEIEGTGIGLTISRELMMLMHGDIGVNTEKGKGSEFWVDCQLSVNMSRDLPNTEKSKFDHRGADHSILCIEDNSANRRVMEQIVKRKTKFAISFAINAKDGIEQAQMLLPSVILMDINLPGIDGFEALKQIQNNPELKHIPVIAISASATKENMAKGLQSGFKHYMTKPIDADELIEKIFSVVDLEKRRVS